MGFLLLGLGKCWSYWSDNHVKLFSSILVMNVNINAKIPKNINPQLNEISAKNPTIGYKIVTTILSTNETEDKTVARFLLSMCLFIKSDRIGARRIFIPDMSKILNKTK